jgi:hypothetical protein
MIRPSSDPDHPGRWDRAWTDEELQLREHCRLSRFDRDDMSPLLQHQAVPEASDDSVVLVLNWIHHREITTTDEATENVKFPFVADEFRSKLERPVERDFRDGA